MGTIRDGVNLAVPHETGREDRDGDTNAFVNTNRIGEDNGLFRARAAARNGLRWHFSPMSTRGATAAPHPSFIPLSPTVSSCFFAP